MKVLSKPFDFKRLKQIELAVKRAEQKFMPSGFKEKIGPNDWGFFFPEGPRHPSYHATPPRHLLRHFVDLTHIKKTGLSPDSHFADLGSGLGMVCFTAAMFPYFREVTGIEIDPHLHAEAEKIRQKFGVRNVEFRNADFMNADLREFDVLYFFRPYKDSFVQLMRDKLVETNPGTIVISYGGFDIKLFRLRAFRPIYPINWKPSEEHVWDFYAFVRK